ncbi:hypothetical protein ACFQZI_10980 [Mucilaginibacter lutimaris]|uniref:Uncharacterized protein n=1 Tax=Mucilaginibacter lutimaris TaxID=931629 RepID=A0ABW2ZGQ3_9SPHI
MENKPEGFDRANGQGQNHDTEGNVANVGNDTLKQQTDNPDLAKEVPTVTPENDNEGGGDTAEDDTSNKGQGPSGENL